MSEAMHVEDYLAQGGVLSSPNNTPPRYRGELMRLMATFVDSELAGAAGFADAINSAPGLRERIAAARMVAEKLDHGGRVLDIMGSFGADVSRYADAHPWASRIGRDEDIGATRAGHDMRLSVFNYPLEGWIDAVVMNVLMGRAVTIQLGELARGSYQPLAQTFREILQREEEHANLAVAGLKRIVQNPGARPAVDAAIAYWRPRVAATFGSVASRRFEQLKRFGLRQRPNEVLLSDWSDAVGRTLGELKLTWKTGDPHAQS